MTNNDSIGIFEGRGIGVFNNIETPALITVTSGALASSAKNPLNIMVTGFNGQVSESYQAMKSFTEDVYITLFGQALSMYKLSCITLPNDEVCDNAKTTLDSLINIYKEYRIGGASRPILNITLDGMTIRGFLVAMPIGTRSVGNSNTISFTLDVIGQVVGL